MNDLKFEHRFVRGNVLGAGPLLLLHGTGGNESDMLSMGHSLDPGAALLSPRGRVMENGMPRFFRRYAEGVFDEEDIMFRAHELADFILAAGNTYGFTVPLIAVGYSNGANIAHAILLLRPEILSAAVLFRPMVIFSNPAAADLRGKRILISAGQNDPIVPPENAERLAGLLKASGAAVTFRLQEASHGLINDDLALAKTWFGT